MFVIHDTLPNQKKKKKKMPTYNFILFFWKECFFTKNKFYFAIIVQEVQKITFL